MEKTLYLCENPKIRVRRDGPSLWVEHEGFAGHRIPARLVRRVLIRGNVALDAGCLTLFAERGVPITLLRQDGRSQAVVLPIRASHERRCNRQRGLWEDPDKRGRFLSWLVAWEQGRRMALIARLDPSLGRIYRRAGFRTEDYETFLGERMDLDLHGNGERTFIASLIFEHVLAAVIAEGWDPQIGVRRTGGPLGLAHDFTEALGADGDRIWLEIISRGPAPLATSYSLVREFECARPRLDKLLRILLRQYDRMLWEP